MAVVVFPTPPFWFAMAMILAKTTPQGLALEFNRKCSESARCFT